MNKIKTLEDAIKLIKDNSSIMMGGFLGSSAPLKLIDELARQEVKDITLIMPVASFPGGDFDISHLTEKKLVKKFIGAHIGTDPNLHKQYQDNQVEVEFNPMGTLVERIRAGGAGLGAVVTPTGIGTQMEKETDKITYNGKEYLMYTPLRADVAIVKARKADKMGNLEYVGTGIGVNPYMAMAADLVIAEVDEIVEIGEIDPNNVGTPGPFVDFIVQGNTLEERKKIYADIWY